MGNTTFIRSSLGHASRGSPAIAKGSEDEGGSHGPTFFIHNFEELRKLKIVEKEVEGDVMSSGHGFDHSSAELCPTKVPAMMPQPENKINKFLGARFKGKLSKVFPSFVGEEREGGNGFLLLLLSRM